MIRIDRLGYVVTHHEELHKPMDLLIVQTNHSHPTITTGLHTNGPAAIWVKRADMPEGEWMCLGRVAAHVVRAEWIVGGWERLLELKVEITNE